VHKLSFTEEKFFNLSNDNKLKKVIFALTDYSDKKKDFDYLADLVGWLNKHSSYKVNIPENENQCIELKKYLIELLVKENPFTEEMPVDDKERERRIFRVVLLLEDIRSPYNVGSIFRNAESFGVERIILTGITPVPEKNKKILRTSRDVSVNYDYCERSIDAVYDLKNNGYRIYSVEKSSNSIDLKKIGLESPLVLIFGNEEFGVSKEVLSLSDRIIHISMFGKKNSLNVSVASGIALYEAANKIILRGK
jgi:tRNA G18 (ribose-2'-O)-methylase SpoU